MPLPNRASQGYQDLLILCLHDTNRVTSLHSVEDRFHSRSILEPPPCAGSQGNHKTILGQGCPSYLAADRQRVTSPCEESNASTRYNSLNIVSYLPMQGVKSHTNLQKNSSSELPPHTGSQVETSVKTSSGMRVTSPYDGAKYPYSLNCSRQSELPPQVRSQTCELFSIGIGE